MRGVVQSKGRNECSCVLGDRLVFRRGKLEQLTVTSLIMSNTGYGRCYNQCCDR